MLETSCVSVSASYLALADFRRGGQWQLALHLLDMASDKRAASFGIEQEGRLALCRICFLTMTSLHSGGEGVLLRVNIFAQLQVV